MESSDIKYMNLAFAAARHAAEREEVPVGAVIVSGGGVIGTGYNCREEQQDPLGHAELMAIGQAARSRRSWRLDDCEIFVTLEPCLMCTGAILQARMKRLVFACLDPKAGAVESLYRLCDDQRLNHRLPVTGGVLAQESAAMLAEFFSRLREKKRTAQSYDFS
jgi:tRNA(adenine34) deaminase